MATRVLLVNSDLAKNRGDRAIAEGNIALVREFLPGATIVGLSENPERDRRWYGISFLPMDFQSLRPTDLLRLARVTRQADVVLWGGGEILKDYTNKGALWYWVAKMALLSLVNRNVYGAYQGIGPTSSPLSKRLIAFIVGRCRAFIVREAESRDKLVSWGVDPARVHAASDPAVLPEPRPLDAALRARLRHELDLDAEFLADFVCIGPRDWFHYRTGGVLPYKYRQRLRKLTGRAPAPPSADHARYRAALRELVAELLREGHRILLLPMHMTESDAEVCRELAQVQPQAVRVLDGDTFSPAELRTVVAQARAMIGFRLHSTIIAVSAGVPCLNIYYVDKGRLFFEQIGQQQYSLPVDRALTATFAQDVAALLRGLLTDRAGVSADIERATQSLRASVRSAFGTVVDE